VDTASNPKFGTDFAHYFRSNGEIQFKTGQELEFLNDLTCYPHSVQGRLNSYLPTDLRSSPVCEVNSGEEITFNFQKKYSEGLLVHQQFGGGLNSIDLCEILEIQPQFGREAIERVTTLGGKYNAVHVRHSDYETDWKPQLEALGGKLNDSVVLLATDNSKLVAEAKESFPDLVIVGTDSTHDGSNPDQNLEVLFDLALLVNSDELFIFKLSDPNVNYSGFSLLAKYLWTVRKVRLHGFSRLLFSRSLFLDFHHSRFRMVRFMFFVAYYVPRINKHAKRSTFFR
jgi:hypothetical protein